MIRCDYCGNLNYQGNVFCTDCGSILKSENYVPPPPQVWKSTDENLPLSEAQKQNKTQPNFPTSQPTSPMSQPPFNPPQQSSFPSTQPSFYTHQQSPHFPSTQPPFHMPQQPHLPVGQQSVNPSTPSSVFQPSRYCWVCQKNVFPLVRKKISTAGWIVFAILLILFFPLFWVGFLIREEVHYCPYCYTQIR